MNDFDFERWLAEKLRLQRKVRQYRWRVKNFQQDLDLAIFEKDGAAERKAARHLKSARAVFDESFDNLIQVTKLLAPWSRR